MKKETRDQGQDVEDCTMSPDCQCPDCKKEAEQYLVHTTPKGICFCSPDLVAHVHTIHDNQRCDIVFGDWIIPEPDGIHFYPCKPDIFQATYEPVSETPND